MHRFFGYGSWSAPLWFVGMEEGGGGDLEKRVNAWDGSGELADLYEYHARIGVDQWFEPEPKIQPTWGKLCRIALAADKRATDQESVRRYQADELGRKNGKTALIELLPLASRSISEWEHGSTREQYMSDLLPHRRREIRRRIILHHPRGVVFYGLSYADHWKEIAGVTFTAATGERFFAGSNDATRFVIAPHPNKRGVTNSLFEEIGSLLAT